ncbi:MAG: hypothetical protein Kow0042_32060 [Calditrichia bacterium]
MKKKAFENLPALISPLLFVTAMRKETRILVENPNSRLIRSRGKISVFAIQAPSVYLLETGMGVPDGRDVLQGLLEEIHPALLINYGVCAALNPQVNVGSSYLIRTVHFLQEPPIPLDNPYLNRLQQNLPELKEAELISSPQPILARRDREKLPQGTNCSLLDMEAFEIAHAARVLSIPLIVLKTVSDYADENARHMVNRHWDSLRRELQNRLDQLIRHLPGITHSIL